MARAKLFHIGSKTSQIMLRDVTTHLDIPKALDVDAGDDVDSAQIYIGRDEVAFEPTGKFLNLFAEAIRVRAEFRGIANLSEMKDERQIRRARTGRCSIQTKRHRLAF